MKRSVLIRHVLIYGLTGGVLIALLKWAEYRFVVVDRSIEIYSGLIAATFAGFGIWLGLRISGKPRESAAEREPVTGAATVPEAVVAIDAGDAKQREDVRDGLGITRRELEILELIAQGMSNREIAEKLFVSENTVKTHSSRVFDKLGAKRRTQAVQLGKEFGLLR